eukprot:GHVL01005197.1.p1 GENE.GHVL01005197.1~~GHVL01005197.1.p1  ORF type:complete len:120 (+),score=12.35 GHVL01005197.1:1362-1721(+)
MMPEILAECKNFPSMVVTSVIGIILIPVMQVVWLDRNTGNANFLFHMMLLHHIFSGFALIDCTKAAVTLIDRDMSSRWIEGIILELIDSKFTSHSSLEKLKESGESKLKKEIDKTTKMK